MPFRPPTGVRIYLRVDAGFSCASETQPKIYLGAGAPPHAGFYRQSVRNFAAEEPGHERGHQELRARGRAGARFRSRPRPGRGGVRRRAVPGTAYRANAISVAVPVAGSAMATGCAYREFRRYGARSARAGVALTIAGVFSAVTFAMLAAAGAIITGNLAVAAAAAAGGAAAGAAAGLALISLRFPRPRARLERLAVAVLSTSGRVTGRPRGEVAALVSGSLARADSVRLGYRSGWRALACALAN